MYHTMNPVYLLIHAHVWITVFQYYFDTVYVRVCQDLFQVACRKGGGGKAWWFQVEFNAPQPPLPSKKTCMLLTCTEHAVMMHHTLIIS